MDFEDKKIIKRKTPRHEVPDLMFQRVKIPESLALTPLNPAIDEVNQMIIPRNPASQEPLDWDIPNEPLVTDENVPPTPNPHTNPHESEKKKQK